MNHNSYDRQNEGLRDEANELMYSNYLQKKLIDDNLQELLLQKARQSSSRSFAKSEEEPRAREPGFVSGPAGISDFHTQRDFGSPVREMDDIQAKIDQMMRDIQNNLFLPERDESPPVQKSTAAYRDPEKEEYGAEKQTRLTSSLAFIHTDNKPADNKFAFNTKVSENEEIIPEIPPLTDPDETEMFKMERIVPEPEEADEEADLKSPLQKVISLAGDILVVVLCIGLVVGSTLFALSSDPGKSIFGYRLYSVATSSMKPSEKTKEEGLTGGFDQGALIFVKKCDPSQIQLGDIITFSNRSDGTSFLTHRVVEILTELDGEQGLYFITRGDANDSNDPAIPADMLVGKAEFSIPAVGNVIKFIREQFVLSIIFVVALFGFVIAMRMFFKKPEEPQKKGNGSKAAKQVSFAK